MTHHELLQEQYEDALFALLMDELAVSEGRKALREAEALNNDPDAAVPEEVVLRCRQTIDRAFRKRELARAGRTGRRAGKRLLLVAVVILALAALMFTTVLAVSPAARRSALNLAIETFQTDITIGFREGESDAVSPAAENTAALSAGWSPLGFLPSGAGTTPHSIWQQYSGPDGSYILAKRFDSEHMGLAIDSETPNVVPVTIQCLPAYFVEKEGELRISFFDGAAGIAVDIVAAGLSREDLVQFAEHLRYK